MEQLRFLRNPYKWRPQVWILSPLWWWYMSFCFLHTIPSVQNNVQLIHRIHILLPSVWSEWLSLQVGHLHAGCSKEVTITFFSTEPVRLRNQMMKCMLYEVTFEQPVEEVADWDDRQKSLQWLNSSPQASVATQQDATAKVKLLECQSFVYHRPSQAHFPCLCVCASR